LIGNFGMAWGVGGWLLTPFLQKIGPAAAQKLRERVLAELKTTFASPCNSAKVLLRRAQNVVGLGLLNSQ